MTEITSGFETLTILFGVFSTLAIMVTGFLVGRRWLGDVGGKDDEFEEDESAMRKRWDREEDAAISRGDW